MINARSFRKTSAGMAVLLVFAMMVLALAPTESALAARGFKGIARSAHKAATAPLHPNWFFGRSGSRTSVHGSVFIGGPIYTGGAWWYSPPPHYGVPYAYYGDPAGPVQYIEKGDAEATTQAPTAFWYFCPDSQQYYPAVESCASAWQPVAPLPETAN